MNSFRQFAIRCMAGVVLAASLGGCGAGGEDSTSPAPTAGIGPVGGTVATSGAQLVVPAGALAQDTAIAIEATRVGAPALPAGTTEFGPMLALTPHGTTFTTPATVTVPFDPALIPAGTQPQLFKTNAALTAFEPVAGATVSGATMVAPLSSFSFVIVGGVPPLTRHMPSRSASFRTILPDFTEASVADFSNTTGEDFSRSVEFGPLLRNQPRQAIGVATFSNFGDTYGAFAEAPSGLYRFNGQLSSFPVGSVSRVGQSQSFTKNTASASLTFTLSAFQLQAYDETPLSNLGDSIISAEGSWAIAAYTDTGVETFYFAESIVDLFGEGEVWGTSIVDGRGATHALLTREHFDDMKVIRWQPTGRCERVEALLTLTRPITFRVDLSAVAVGQEFTVVSILNASPLNHKGSGFASDCQGSGASVNLRDPLGIGGTTMAFTGLTPTNRPLPQQPSPTVPLVPACTGPDLPEAGSVQFEAVAYDMRDSALEGTQSVRITRTGGKSGAATFRLFSQDVSTTAGADYIPVDRTVFFGDGYDSVRTETINVNFRPGAQGNRTFNLFLERTGGCARTGVPTQAAVVIRD